MRHYTVGAAGLAVNQLGNLGWFDSIMAHSPFMETVFR